MYKVKTYGLLGKLLNVRHYMNYPSEFELKRIQSIDKVKHGLTPKIEIKKIVKKYCEVS